MATHQQRKFIREKCWFCDFNWLTWQRPLSDHQNGAGFINLLPEILVKIHLVVPEIDLFQGRPLKIEK